MKINITHLTSAHPRYDTRILVKECSSLAKNEIFNVNLLVADGLGDEYKNGVHIYDVGKLKGRVNRIFKTTGKVFSKALAMDSDIYHFHDPELLFVGLRLKKMGYKVIYDVHEDVPKQILSKHYINRFLRLVIAFFFKKFEDYCAKRFDAVITATPYIRDRFLILQKNTHDISNFPIIEELSHDIAWKERAEKVCYVGALSRVRGIGEIVEAMKNIEDVTLTLAGTFFDKSLQDEVEQNVGWNKVNYLGFVDREAIKKILSESKVGLVTLHPIINYQDALPVKMFEYMLAGIPVVTSNIKLWQDIVEDAKCGICVDPYDSEAIANAIKVLMKDSALAEEMGRNGKKAVLEKYNWSFEERKLFDVYRGLTA